MELSQTRTHQAKEHVLSMEQEELSHLGLLQLREAHGESSLFSPSA